MPSATNFETDFNSNIIVLTICLELYNTGQDCDMKVLYKKAVDYLCQKELNINGRFCYF